MSEKMTPKQAIFVAEYLIDGNGTRAAIAAGCSASSAHVTAARWLKQPKIAAAVADGHERRSKKLEVTAERVIEELAKLAFYDTRDLFDASGQLKPIHQLDDISRAAIASLEVETKAHPGGIILSRIGKVKMADKGLNLERLGRYLKLFTDRIEHDGRVTLEKLVCGGLDGESGDAAHS